MDEPNLISRLRSGDRRALEEITGKQVFRKALWFFEPGELILL